MRAALLCLLAAAAVGCRKEEPAASAPPMAMPARAPEPAVPEPAAATLAPAPGSAAPKPAAVRPQAPQAGTEKSFDAALKSAKGLTDDAHALSKRIAKTAKAAKAVPDFPSIHKLLGKGKAAEAAALLQQRVAVDPADREAWRELGFLHKGLGKDPAESLPFLKRALELDPGHGHLVAETVDVYRRAGRREEGAGELEALSKRFPDSEDLLMARGELLRELGKPAESLALYQKAAAVPDASLETKKGLARALEHSKEPAKAAAAWREVLAFHEEALRDVRAHGDKTDAIEQDVAAAQLELARALAAAGDLAGAKAVLDAVDAKLVDPKALEELRRKLP